MVPIVGDDVGDRNPGQGWFPLGVGLFVLTRPVRGDVVGLGPSSCGSVVAL